MNTSDKSEPKPIFFAIWNSYHLSGALLQTLTNMADVGSEVVDQMIMGSPVPRVDAEKVLAALSRVTGRSWVLSNMDIPLLDEKPLTTRPTFLQLCTRYQFDDNVLWEIAKKAKVGKGVIDVMRVGSPVERDEAVAVLRAVAQLTGVNWTLSDVDIPLVDAEQGDE